MLLLQGQSLKDQLVEDRLWGRGAPRKSFTGLPRASHDLCGRPGSLPNPLAWMLTQMAGLSKQCHVGQPVNCFFFLG